MSLNDIQIVAHILSGAGGDDGDCSGNDDRDSVGDIEVGGWRGS